MAYDSKEWLSAIANLREFTTARMSITPVGVLQRETSVDRKAKGPSWVSRVTLPAPTDTDIFQLLLDATRFLGDGNEKLRAPTLDSVQAQWTGFRAGVSKSEPEPKISETEKFSCLEKETQSTTTILYFHGGSNYLLGPAARRDTARTLAELTGGKCLTVQHRLAPQHPFPAALLDFLIAYLSLLRPPPGSLHAPVQAQHIVFSGDSSGCGIALAIIQIILAARELQATLVPTVRFNGEIVELPMPAGLAFQSPSMDNQHDTMPSWAANVSYDVVPAEPPGYSVDFPADGVWPSQPPRGNYYCETSVLYHPLVCALASKSWIGCPPIYMAVGSKERLSDGAKFVAQRAARQGVSVLWDEYELMPHNWPMVFHDQPQSAKCYRNWAEACSSFAQGAPVQAKGTLTRFKSLEEVAVDVNNLSSYTMDEVRALMGRRQMTIKPFTGGRSTRSVL